MSLRSIICIAALAIFAGALSYTLTYNYGAIGAIIGLGISLPLGMIVGTVLGTADAGRL